MEHYSFWQEKKWYMFEWSRTKKPISDASCLVTLEKKYEI
jgi:hypothetical protein